MVLYVVEKRINRKILDQEIFDGSYTKLIIAEDFNFEAKVIITLPLYLLWFNFLCSDSAYAGKINHTLRTQLCR